MEIRDKNQEHFVCISLNGANEVIEKRVVTMGLSNTLANNLNVTISC